MVITPLPPKALPVNAMTPLEIPGTPTWLILSEDGRIHRWESDSGACDLVGTTTLVAQLPSLHAADHERASVRIHASPSGRFAAVVIDYGSEGVVIDLSTGQQVLELHGGTYCEEHVPFSIAFANHQGREILIHRTDWNRLDATDLVTGEELAARATPEPASDAGVESPPHYLDYFHGALHANPSGSRIADDGWLWHPLGEVSVWSIEPWLADNPFESEDGASLVALCWREYYWDHAMVWLDDHRIAVGGIGDRETNIVPGARIFDLRRFPSGPHERSAAPEVFAFAGPGDRFFAADGLLYAVAESGLEVWDPDTGARLGSVPDFHPTLHHRTARELAARDETSLIRWLIQPFSEAGFA
ncbi:hypothetical protein [Actinospica robiniae]|uniref:hypothetical protein n=1 Tax=Actinospica robiniae TaxID=304901 RepID=UPI0003FB891B|nr:hypothetical protein [Actinospica robiniae]